MGRKGIRYASVLYEDSDILVAVKPAGSGIAVSQGLCKGHGQRDPQISHHSGQKSTKYPQINHIILKRAGEKSAALCGSYPQIGPACVGNYGVCQKSKGCSFS